MAAYGFQAQPRAVTNRPKYREEELATVKTHIQADPRVFRGSTVAPRGTVEEKPQRTMRRGKPKEADPSPFALPLPPPDRIPIDLDVHLIAPEAIVAVAQSESQTDTFLPEAPEPEYVPRKTGLDAQTQIYEGDLFSFDVEVAPILDVLTTKTLEQALTEVAEETELESVSQFKQEWERRQIVLLEDWEKTVAVEAERAAEKQKILEAAKARKAKELALMQKLACARIAEQYTRKVVPTTIQSLIKAGQFPETARQPLEDTFWPWLFEKVHEVQDKMRACDECVMDLVETASRNVNRRKIDSAKQLKERLDKQKRADSEQQEGYRGNIRIYLKTDSGDIVVGPIRVSSAEDIRSVNERTFKWLEENHPDVAATAPHGVTLFIGDKPAGRTVDLFSSALGSISLKPAAEQPKEDPPE